MRSAYGCEGLSRRAGNALRSSAYPQSRRSAQSADAPGCTEQDSGVHGEDGGLFAFALETLRRVGGVLEHPAYSDAWAAYGLPRPVTGGEWCHGAHPGEWTCYVEQWRYGHRAKKATWLYVVGLRSEAPPALRWGHILDAKAMATWDAGIRRGPVALVSWCGNHVATGEKRERLGKKAAIHTPPAFREELLRLARWAVTE